MESQQILPDRYPPPRKPRDGNGPIRSFVLFAALALFVAIGGQLGSQIVRTFMGYSEGTNQIMVTALLLNVALILLTWRRTNALSDEIQVYRQAEVRAQHLAMTDPLTNLYNRRAFKEKTSEMIARASRLGKSIAFLMIDLDGFKKVNDTYGHDSGDIVLREAADRMREVVPQSSVIARLGGDEFVICLMFEPEFPDTVDKIAKHLIEAFARPVAIADASQMVTASIGISRPGRDCAAIDILMRRADIALYAAKTNGRNGYRWFDNNMEIKPRSRSPRQSDNRDTISTKAFVPFFEPQVDLHTGELVGFEVLARWISPIGGLDSPDDLIPVADKTGMNDDLSITIFQQALLEAKNWDPSLTISVNISPAQLQDLWLAQKIFKLLVETGFPANRLEVEIPESALFSNLSIAQSTMGSLKSQGIQIALDDFGSGDSSLAHLRALPFDRIKIGRSCVSSMLDNAESAAIVQAVAGLGRTLQVPIIAQGVEDDHVLAKLKEFGCSKGQGALFGHPLNIDQARNLLIDNDLFPKLYRLNPAHAKHKAKVANHGAY
jgi:diguanylate cyclase (GGDEF)-like protein